MRLDLEMCVKILEYRCIILMTTSAYDFSIFNTSQIALRPKASPSQANGRTNDSGRTRKSQRGRALS